MKLGGEVSKGGQLVACTEYLGTNIWFRACRHSASLGAPTASPPFVYFAIQVSSIDIILYATALPNRPLDTLRQPRDLRSGQSYAFVPFEGLHAPTTLLSIRPSLGRHRASPRNLLPLWRTLSLLHHPPTPCRRRWIPAQLLLMSIPHRVVRLQRTPSSTMKRAEMISTPWRFNPTQRMMGLRTCFWLRENMAWASA